MTANRMEWRKNQTEKRKRLILERPAPDYPDRIDTQGIINFKKIYFFIDFSYLVVYTYIQEVGKLKLEISK